MRALIQVFPLLLVLFCFVARANLRKFLLLAAIITLPFRITDGIGYTDHPGWADGIEVSLSDIFFFLFAVHTLLTGRMRRGFFRADNVTRGLLMLAGAGALSMINTVSKQLTFYQVVMIIQVLVVAYVCVVSGVHDKSDLNAVLLGISLSLILQGVIGSAQFALQRNFLLFSTGYSPGETIVIGDEGSGFIRVFGTVGKPNAYAMFLAPLLLMNIALLSIKELPGRRLRILSLLLGFLGLIFSGSRGGWLSCSVALMVYFAFLMRKYEGRRMQIIGSVFVLLLLVSCAGRSFIAKRLTADDRNAAGSRVPIVGIAIEMIKAHPIAGVGANTYHNVMRRYLPANYGEQYVDQVHNTYLLVLAEMGVVGFLACFLLLRNLFKEGLASLRKSDSSFQKVLGLGLTLVLVQVAVHSFVEAYISKPIMCSLFCLTGTVVAARKFHV